MPACRRDGADLVLEVRVQPRASLSEIAGLHGERLRIRLQAPPVDGRANAALHPDRSARQIAWLFTDEQGYFISESSTYRILKGYDLVESPAFTVITAANEFKHPTKRVNELWQTDFTYFKILNWGWYYLSTVLDDFSPLHPGLETDPDHECNRRARHLADRLWQKQAWTMFSSSIVRVCSLTMAPAISPRISSFSWSVSTSNILVRTIPPDDTGQDRTLRSRAGSGGTTRPRRSS